MPVFLLFCIFNTISFRISGLMIRLVLRPSDFANASGAATASKRIFPFKLHEDSAHVRLDNDGLFDRFIVEGEVVYVDI